MSLHPHIRQAVDAAAALPAYDTLASMAEVRALANAGNPPRANPVAVASVDNFSIPGPAADIPVRLYRPPVAGRLPALVYLHGGGFVALGLDSHDDICRRLCVGAGCLVLSVDYRLAPEHRCPAGADDALAATVWLAQQADRLGLDPARIVVGGDSAGGCLAAVTAMRLRDRPTGDNAEGLQLAGQLLFYPVTDHPSPPPPSWDRYGSGWGLTARVMRWFWDQYLAAPGQRDDPLASPARMARCAGLPPAYVMVAEYDLLRDEGQAFADRLAAEGVATRLRLSPGVNHGFLKYAGTVPESDATLADASDWLRSLWR